MNLDTLYEIRKENLNLLINNKYDGTAAKFAKAMGMNPQTITHLKRGSQKASEDLFRDIEAKAELPFGLMDCPNMINTDSYSLCKHLSKMAFIITLEYIIENQKLQITRDYKIGIFSQVLEILEKIEKEKRGITTEIIEKSKKDIYPKL